MGWTEMIREQHPDILIGYNTFGLIGSSCQKEHKS